MLKYLFICVVLNAVQFLKAEMSVDECHDLGFTKTQLMCSNCDKLDDFGLETIKLTCRECCTVDQLPIAQQRYPHAILEVCTCKFRAYPQIQAFIKSGRPAKFPNLTIKYVRGLDPIIKLLDAESRIKETLSITKWNTDTVEEFFETHLEKQHSKGNKKEFRGMVEEQESSDSGDDFEAFLRTNFGSGLTMKKIHISNDLHSEY